eukprot:3978701-Karenia_brevis.AAC.1
MGQNNAAYGLCFRELKVPSTCSEDISDDGGMNFPPSDDDTACRAFLNDIGLDAQNSSSDDSEVD